MIVLMDYNKAEGQFITVQGNTSAMYISYVYYKNALLLSIVSDRIF